MESLYGSSTSLTSKKSPTELRMGTQKPPANEEASFYTACRAAYLTVFRSSLDSIIAKEQLCLVLQQAGRNPSSKTLSRYWTAKTKELNFDDFCSIVRREKPAAKADLVKAFRSMDPAGRGYVSHDDLYKVLTTKGEKMSPEEVNAVLRLADVNSDSKLDYDKFCRVFSATCDQCTKMATERMNTNSQAKRQQFGSQTETSPERSSSPRMPRDGNTTPRKVDSKSSRPSSARKYKATMCTVISMGLPNSKNSKLAEPKSVQDWQNTQSKGCFFLEGTSIITHHYKMQLPQKSAVHLSIKPLNLSRVEGKSSPWMSVDTALYIIKENDGKEEPQLISFTEFRNKEAFVWTGDLAAGSYTFIPFTTGCRLTKKKKQAAKEAQLVYRDDNEDIALTPEFRSALSDMFDIIDLDGSGSLSLEEYNFFELRTSGEKCDEEAWEVCKENFETKKNELTRKGFADLHLMEAKDREGDPSDLWVTLHSMGYNKALELTEACPFIIKVCAEKCKPTLRAASLESGSRQLQKIVCKSVMLKGEAKPMDGYESVILHTYKNDSRISSVIENKSDKKIVMQVSNDESKNCVSSRGLSVFAVEALAKSSVVSQHVMAMSERQEWLYNCIQSILP